MPEFVEKAKKIEARWGRVARSWDQTTEEERGSVRINSAPPMQREQEVLMR